MPTPTLRHLFAPAAVERYLDAVGLATSRLASTLTRVDGPSTGRTPEQASRPVAEVDLDRPLGDLEEVLEELATVYLDDTVWFHDPAYAAHLNCPVVIPALAAEVFVSAVNTSMDTFDQSVGATFVERHLIRWTAERIGLPTSRLGGADGVFTSGGTQSNLQALLLARETALERHAVDADRLRVLVSADGHFSVRTAARVLGLADDAVVVVGVDEQRRMRTDRLAEALSRCRDTGTVPMAVVATAGTTDFGAIDPLPQVAAACRKAGAWLHVDAAYGGGLLVSRRHRHLLDGLELADSVTVDYHKTWFQPVSCSAVVVRDATVLRHLTHHADYLNPAGSTDPNQVDKSMQTTRRFDALKLWTTLRTMGPDLVGDYLDRVVDLTAGLARALDDLDGVELAAPPSLSTLVLRYREGAMGPRETDEVNRRARAELYRRGTAMVAATRVDGETWLKLTLLNPAATEEGLLALVTELRDCGRALAGPASRTEVA